MSSNIPHKPAITRVPIHDLIARRWSPWPSIRCAR